ncbi:hypothetical protein AB1Y20_001427 [Prymnesium parvum]|uniref:Nucleotide-diphospho-sugar transferase domain-containing protein n=1 Tax=Prymnesium parvum TaxID=97485 RepID=A0AB34K8C6_PRYPA
MLKRALLSVIALAAVLLLYQRQLLSCRAASAERLHEVSAPPAAQSEAQSSPPCSDRLILPIEALPAGLPGLPSDPIFLTFATASVDELLTNWVLHVNKLRLPALVAAMDFAVTLSCRRLGVHCLSHSLAADSSLDLMMVAEARRHHKPVTAVNIRGNATLFNGLGARKVASILVLLERSGRAVFISDVDVVWLKDPGPLVSGALQGLEDFATADILASNDCIDPERDRLDDGCFHTLIDRNTGVLFVRNTSNAVLAMREWRVRTSQAHSVWETDQTAFDDLLRGRGRGHRRDMSDAQRKEWYQMKLKYCGLPQGTIEGNSMGVKIEGEEHTNGSRHLFKICIPPITRDLRFGLLPLLDVANGHSFFIQQLQLQTGRWPYAVHATYQYFDDFDCAFGKRERFRMWDMWLADDVEMPLQDESSAASACSPTQRERRGGGVTRRVDDTADMNYLVLHDDAPIAPAAEWVGQADPHVLGRQHVAHLNAFRQRLAYGVVLAKALNRTVVLPPYYCYCDKYWARLTRCTVGMQALGTQPLPFLCPMDHVFPIASWHGNSVARQARPRRCELAPRADLPPFQGMPYRSHSWLHRLPQERHLQPSSAHLHVSAASPPPPGHAILSEARVPSRLGHQELNPTVPFSFRGPGIDPARRITHLPGTSDRELASVLRTETADVRLLHVTLDDARSMLGCVSDRRAFVSLFQMLFTHRWCFRPEEMIEPRNVTNATDGTTHEVDVCMWGFAVPTPPPQCTPKMARHQTS